jgi:hypothetical protein
LGVKRSEEPYAREDLDLLVAIASSLALLEKPSPAGAPRSNAFEECPQCGVCYDSGVTQCSRIMRQDWNRRSQERIESKRRWRISEDRATRRKLDSMYML